MATVHLNGYGSQHQEFNLSLIYEVRKNGQQLIGILSRKPSQRAGVQRG